jgi:hypothetical protein
MSESTIESVQLQLNSVQTELNNANNVIKFFQAQMEAQKGMLNEQLASNIQLRTNLHILSLENRDKDEKIKLLTPKIE